MDQRVQLVARGHQFHGLLVFVGVRFGIGHHALDFFLAQAGAGLDGDVGFLVGGLVLGAHVQDAVGVDVEGHLDLRHAARCGRDVGQVELAQALVAGRHLALALQHVDGYRILVVFGRGEHLRCLGRDRGVLLDELGHHAAHGLDAQRQRGHVQQQHVLHFALQHAALDRRANRHGLVRVHVLARFLAEEFLHFFLHFGHAGLAADQDHVGDVGVGHARILHRDLARLDGARDQVFHQAFQLGAGDLHGQVFRTGRIRRDVGQVHFGLLRRGQFDLGFFRCVLQALQGQHVLLQVDAVLLLEFVDQEVDHAHVEVFAAEEGVAVGGHHLELMLAVDLGDVDDGDVEGAAAQVIHGDLAVAFLFVQTERQRSRGRLVDDALHFQTGDAAGVFGCLALRVVEIRRNGDYGFGDRLAQVVLGGLLHLGQHLRGDFRRGNFLVAHLHPCVAVLGLDDGVGDHVDVLLHHRLLEATADQALHAVQGVLGIGHGLTLGGRADQHFTVFHVGDDGRGGARAFGVLDHLGLAVFHDGHAGVRRAQVDTDDFSHDAFLSVECSIV